MIELLHSAPLLTLPKEPPRGDPKVGAWYVDVRNLGPNDVTLQGSNGFVVHLHPKDVVRIRALANQYSVGKP